MEPLRLNPIYDKTIWAGDRLARIRGRKPSGEGTSWEISVHPYAQSVIAEGRFKDQTLASLIAEDPDGMLGASVTDEDLMRVAFLDTKDALSVQVHPGERYAQTHEKDHGKTETWYILATGEGASVVEGSDFKSAAEVREAIQSDSIEDHLHRIPVNEGDFILIPSGTLHALGAGILALEIGTNSNTTYRFYDYGRKDRDGNTRELHIDKSLDVVRFGQRGVRISTPLDDEMRVKRVAELPEYHVDLFDVMGETIIPSHKETFRTISCVHGDAVLRVDGAETRLGYTESVFVPASCGAITVRGNCRLLVGTPHPRSAMRIEDPAYLSDFTCVRDDQRLECGVRRLQDIAHLYANTDGIDPQTVLYEVCADEGCLEQSGSLSYGLTTIHPIPINGECPFTAGHWHEDEGCDEIYQGEGGTGLLMYMNHEGDTWCERVFPGSTHHITGELAHRLINTGDVDLKVRAVWSPRAGHNYEAVAHQHFGFRVFRTAAGIEARKHEE